MRHLATIFSATLLACSTLAAQPARSGADIIPSGTEVQVRTNDTIDVRNRADGRVYRGVVAEDVRDRDGRVVIPRGADAELLVSAMSDRQLAVDLESITINGRRYMVEAEAYNKARSSGVGKNERTAKYVGGGAALGALIGAIAGGGKGAAIGAAAGAGAGAGTQVLTRGKEVRVPAESVLTFRLEQPFPMGTGRYSGDAGYNRGQYHYHDGYYNRGSRQ